MKKLQSADILPYRATVILETIGERISLARRARMWTQADLAAKIGISVNTLVGIEKGRANVAIGLVVKALWAIDQLETLSDVAKQENDPETVSESFKMIPKRVRASKK